MTLQWYGSWILSPISSYLNTWYQCGRTIWEKIIRCGLMKGVCHWGQALRFQKTHTIASVLSGSCLWITRWALSWSCCLCSTIMDCNPLIAQLSFYKPWSWCSIIALEPRLRHECTICRGDNASFSLPRSSVIHFVCLSWRHPPTVLSFPLDSAHSCAGTL